MSLITGWLKKNFLFYLLQIIIFTVCFVFVDLCTFLGLQMYSIIGIFLIFGAFIYSVIVITSLFKNQIIIDRDNWNSLSRLGIYLKETFIITGIIDTFFLLISTPISKVISYYVIYRLMEKCNNIKFVMIEGIFVDCLSIFIAFLIQNYYIYTMFEKKREVKDIHISENAPLFLKNIIRNKEKMKIVIGLISFGIITFNSILFLLNCEIGEEGFIDKGISVDYFLTYKDTRSQDLRLNDEFVKREDITFVEKLPSFSDGGRLYHNVSLDRTKLVTDQLPEKSLYDDGFYEEFSKDDQGQYYLNLYGCDDFVFEQMEVYSGTIDYKKLHSGNYIIYGLLRMPSTLVYEGDMTEQWQYFQVGDHISIKGENGEKDYEIMAICAVNHTYAEESPDIYPGGELVFYLPSEEYLNFGDDEVMRYLFNTKNGENIDESLGNISFESKQQWINTYENERKMIRSGGTFFAFFTVVIGFISFLNIIMISYIDRKKEFEVLEHIGMSTMQMRRMILAEGLGYGIVISFISLSISRLIVLLGKLLLTGKSWRYCYTMEPVCYCCIFVLFFTLTVPLLVYKRCR